MDDVAIKMSQSELAVLIVAHAKRLAESNYSIGDVKRAVDRMADLAKHFS